MLFFYIVFCRIHINYIWKINENFYNKTFVITGTLEKYTRDEIEEKIGLLGGKTSSSVGKKTSAVIVGANPGSKYEKAKSLGIEIWSEEEFKDKISWFKDKISW